MKRSRKTTTFLVVLVLGLICSSAHAEERIVGVEKWNYQFTPYAWLSSMDVDAKLGGLSGAVDVDADQVLDALGFGGASRFEAWKNRWGLFVDTMYMALSDDYSNTFGLGSGLTLTWNFLAGVDMRLKKNTSLRLGYRIMVLTTTVAVEAAESASTERPKAQSSD